MPIDCETARENIDALALGALDADEAPALEQHLQTCIACARELRAARETAASLALSAPAMPAAAALKARVMASAAVLSTRPRRRPSWNYWAVAAAALAVLAAGGVTWGALMQRHASDLSGQTARAEAQATQSSQQLASLVSWQRGMLEVSSQADLRTTPMNGTVLAPSASGQYFWSTTKQEGAFFATGMPPLPAGKAYTFWFIYAGKWENAGTATVTGDQARLIVHLDENEDGGGAPKGFAVTIEPASGAPTRSGAMVLQSGTRS